MAKRRIMDSATDLFAKRGYGIVGINEVGVTAGFGKGALYYHIRSKEDLLISIVSEHMGRIISQAKAATDTEGSTEHKVAALIRAFVDCLFENTAAMTVSYRDIHAIVEPENSKIVADLHADYKRIWSDILADGATAGMHRPVTDTEIDAFLAMLFSSVFWVDETSDPERLAATFTRTVVSTVKAPLG